MVTREAVREIVTAWERVVAAEIGGEGQGITDLPRSLWG